MVFQNSENSTETDNILQKSVNCNLERSRSLRFDLDCQKVLPFQKLARGKIPDNFKIGTINVPKMLKTSLQWISNSGY